MNVVTLFLELKQKLVKFQTHWLFDLQPNVLY